MSYYDQVFWQQAANVTPCSGTLCIPGFKQQPYWVRHQGGAHFVPYAENQNMWQIAVPLPTFSIPPGHLPPIAVGPTSTSVMLRPRKQPRRHAESLFSICISWKEGRCVYPSTCIFRHICATCHQRHMANDCVDTLDDSEYKNDM